MRKFPQPMKPTVVQRQDDGGYAVQLTGQIGEYAIPHSYWVRIESRQAIHLVRSGVYLARHDEIVL
jgi:hypothetical protein